MGGGNHFLEIQQDQNNFIWFMIHSGSRNLGKQIADYYYALAKHFREDFEKELGGITPVEWQIDALPVDSSIGQSYIREMNYALDFALYNRRKMANDVNDIFCQCLGQIDFEDEINIHHNYAAKENHFGETVWVHRKGATNASIGTIGIIPGSQGTNSYIVKGLGNEDSYESCSHGAGRLLGRNQAKKNLNLEEQQKMLDDQGILHSIRGVKDLDEAPGAYKDIDCVLEQEKDLVSIITKLSPLAVVKG
jgi:tRNA-splicing ligase RtcB